MPTAQSTTCTSPSKKFKGASSLECLCGEQVFHLNCVQRAKHALRHESTHGWRRFWAIELPIYLTASSLETLEVNPMSNLKSKLPCRRQHHKPRLDCMTTSKFHINEWNASVFEAWLQAPKLPGMEGTAWREGRKESDCWQGKFYQNTLYDPA